MFFQNNNFTNQIHSNAGMNHLDKYLQAESMTIIVIVQMEVMSQVIHYLGISSISKSLPYIKGTSACVNGIFYCENKGYKGSTLFSSQVNDGICGKWLMIITEI